MPEKQSQNIQAKKRKKSEQEDNYNKNKKSSLTKPDLVPIVNLESPKNNVRQFLISIINRLINILILIEAMVGHQQDKETRLTFVQKIG